jgi:hypothetical protein
MRHAAKRQDNPREREPGEDVDARVHDALYGAIRFTPTPNKRMAAMRCHIVQDGSRDGVTQLPATR